MLSSIESPLNHIVQRLREAAEDLGKLATTTAATPCEPEIAQPLASLAAAEVRRRQSRKRFLPADLFREPGWDMLLAIYIADRAGSPMNVKALVSMVDAPATTSQRWIEHLDRLGLISRATDPLDRRRIEVSLTEAGQAALETCLRAIAAP